MATSTLSRPPARHRAPAPPPRSRPRWERLALVVLLAGTAVLYLWNLSVTGLVFSFMSGV